MLKRSLLTATVGAGLLALAAGGAYAQSGTSSDPSGSSSSPSASPSTGSGSSTMGGAGTSSGAAGSGSSTMGKSGTGSTAAAPPQDVVGKDIINAQGDKLGEIEEIAGNQVIVSVGGFLGIGDRKVALDWNKVTMQGSGKDARLQTSMTKEELQSLPEYKAEGGSGGATGGGSTRGTGGGTSAPSR